MNIEMTEEEMAKVRLLDDFDLIMFLSEINDHRWEVARETLKIIPVKNKGEGH